MTFAPLRCVVGPAISLLLPNIDTDVIIRVERMTSTDPAALSPFAFEALRYRDDGTENADCPLNNTDLRGAPILLCGENFGCGSSREPAVWAIAGLGIRCLIAPSFGDIFAANCGQNGLLAVTLADDDVAQIAAIAVETMRVVVDLELQTITAGTRSWRFEIDRLRKTALLEGLGDLDLTLRYRDVIDNWTATDQRRRPWAWTVSSPLGDAT